MLNFKNREELLANIRLSIARKREAEARIQREWAERDVQMLKQAAL